MEKIGTPFPFFSKILKTQLPQPTPPPPLYNVGEGGGGTMIRDINEPACPKLPGGLLITSLKDNLDY